MPERSTTLMNKEGERMFTRTAGCFAWAVVIWMIASGNSFAADENKTAAIAEALGRATLFAQLTDSERAALQTAATLRRGRAGERIIQEGAAQDSMFIILDGEAEVGVGGKPIVTLPPQSLVGEIGFLDALPASADVILLRDTALIALDNAALTDVMEKHPRIGYLLMREIAEILAERLRATNPK